MGLITGAFAIDCITINNYVTMTNNLPTVKPDIDDELKLATSAKDLAAFLYALLDEKDYHRTLSLLNGARSHGTITDDEWRIFHDGSAEVARVDGVGFNTAIKYGDYKLADNFINDTINHRSAFLTLVRQFRERIKDAEDNAVFSD
jgi:hypothetical protein